MILLKIMTGKCIPKMKIEDKVFNQLILITLIQEDKVK